MGRERGSVEQREKLDSKAISTRASANSIGGFVAGMTLQRDLELE